ncbi:hypothetical protein T492DRAFT_1056114 [Pavlovales sp. CCMP2436]|nr:hypothetical protein T492DRAFT_1056114 [Pavlovales sp. CCMP2436]
MMEISLRGRRSSAERARRSSAEDPCELIAGHILRGVTADSPEQADVSRAAAESYELMSAAASKLNTSGRRMTWDPSWTPWAPPPAPVRPAAAWRGPTALLAYSGAEAARIQFELRIVGRSHDAAERFPRSPTLEFTRSAQSAVVLRVPATATLYHLTQLIDERYLRHVRPLDHGVLAHRWSFSLTRLMPPPQLPITGLSSPLPRGAASSTCVPPAYRFSGPDAGAAAKSHFPPQTHGEAVALYCLGLQAGESFWFVYDEAGATEHVRVFVQSVSSSDPEDEQGYSTGERRSIQRHSIGDLRSGHMRPFSDTLQAGAMRAAATQPATPARLSPDYHSASQLQAATQPSTPPRNSPLFSTQMQLRSQPTTPAGMTLHSPQHWPDAGRRARSNSEPPPPQCTRFSQFSPAVGGARSRTPPYSAARLSTDRASPLLELDSPSTLGHPSPSSLPPPSLPAVSTGSPLGPRRTSRQGQMSPQPASGFAHAGTSPQPTHKSVGTSPLAACRRSDSTSSPVRANTGRSFSPVPGSPSHPPNDNNNEAHHDNDNNDAIHYNQNHNNNYNHNHDSNYNYNVHDDGGGGGGADEEEEGEGRRNRRGKNAPSRQRHSARRAAVYRLKEAERTGVSASN